MEQVRKQATILYNQIAVTRQWVAEHEALLRKKRDGASSNPFLHNADVKLPDGTVFTKLTPSIVTTELSDRASRNGLYYFKLTNVNCLNPNNAPDKLERDSIETFQRSDEKEIFRVEYSGSKPILRYIAPVYVTEDCLSCHSGQGYNPGEIGGCLSIFIPMDEARKAVQKSGAVLFAGTLGFGAILIGLLFVSTRSLLFSRIKEIRSSIDRIHLDKDGLSLTKKGDELKEISDFCYLIDERLKEEHGQLEKRIREATKDFYQTKENLEKANRELENLNIAKSDFFSDISHEFRTPLTNIKGAVDILERISSNDPKYLNIIKRNSDHLIRLVIDLLDYSRIEAGHLELKLENTSLRQLVEDSVIAVEAEAQKKLVKFSVKVDELILNVDRDRIYQVLTNLFSNAIRYSPVDGSILVQAGSLDESLAVISVHDEGPGIEEKYREAIFRKFYQAPIPKESGVRRGSSGIGLAICRALIEAHHGRIWVESRIGSGSKFFFTVPRKLENHAKPNSNS
ncbi:MAG: two-component system, NarL family, sensor histidine kinase BarA [Thermodesulfobacteriota bacterium]|nr:two-component system, NarL family, sensor histidine kinase BarA [Thermodesulfobacteriota bacterium]